LSALAKDLRQRIPTRGWKRERRCGNFLHGGVLLGNWVFEQTKFKPKYAAFFNSSSTTFGYISTVAQFRQWLESAGKGDILLFIAEDVHES
jgi:hypothetical protein